MMKQKIVFLDVDGTLVDFKMTMPESARKALELARENGHLLVLCTGRAYCDIYPWLMEFGFDAVVASAGAHVMHNDTELYHSFIDPKDLSKLAQVFKKHGAACVFQGSAGRFMTEENALAFLEFFRKMDIDMDGKVLQNTIVEEPHLRNDIESGVYQGANVGIDQIQKEVGDAVTITGASFGVDREYNGEFTKGGITKATGMDIVMNHFGMEVSDAVAFGDSQNDIPMLRYAGVSVAMGDGAKPALEAADHVTTPLLEDGIWNGFKLVGLI